MTHLDSAFVEFETAAHEAATSVNARPLPTKAQEVAGNYRKGHARWHGIPVSVENVRNSWRSGVAEDGKPWTNRMAAHYGDFPGTVGADGDPVDVFVGPFPELTQAWVINQRRVAGTPGFDEHKVMVGFTDEQQARDAYLHSYQRNWPGLMSMVPITVGQLKWWLRHGDKSRPISSDQLPSEGRIMKKVLWDRDANPTTQSLDEVMGSLRASDTDGLMLDSVSMDELMTDPDLEAVIKLDAMVVEAYQLGRKMTMLARVMAASGATVKPSGDPVISDPVRMRGVLQVMVLFPMTDGQAVAIWFHNPDTTPGRLTPLDELISWKWMLNKKDVTIVVAPERGQDLNVREVARRIMRLVERNSDAFQRANAKAAERAAAISALEEEIPRLESQLATLQREIEVAEVEAENPRLVPDPAPSVLSKPASLEQGQAALQALAPFLSRGQMSAVREGMRGEEGQFFINKMIELADRIATMPHTYQQDGKGDDAVAYLHYFKGGADWYITEKDKDGDVDQAFGQADLGDGPELGYISIRELVSNGVELDFHFEPTTLGILKGGAKVGETSDETQPVAPAPAPEPAPAPVVELTGTELGDFPATPDGLTALRAAAIEYFRSRLQGGIPVHNIALDKDILLTRAGRKKIEAFSTDRRKLMLVPAIPTILRDGKPTASSPMAPHARAAAKGVKVVHILKTDVQLGGAALTVRTLVYEREDGSLFYDYAVNNEEKVGALGGNTGLPDPAERPNVSPTALLPPELSSEQRTLDSVDGNTNPCKGGGEAIEAVLADAAGRAAKYLDGALLDFAGDVGHAIAQLKVALDVVTTNEPINRAEGAIEQADLERESADQFRKAIGILEGRLAPVLDAAEGPMVVNLFIEGEPPEVLPEESDDEDQPAPTDTTGSGADPTAIPEGQTVDPPAITPEMIARAAELGAGAGARGYAAPAQDPELMAMIPAGVPVGWSLPLLEAWNQAFSAAQAAAPVPNASGTATEGAGGEEGTKVYETWAEWEEDFLSAIEEIAEVDRSDAQGIAMVHQSAIEQAWQAKTPPRVAAQAVLDQPGASAEEPEKTPGESDYARQRQLDLEYLKSFIDGTADVFASDALERMEPMAELYANDPEMMELFTRAAQAYSDAAVAEAQRALAA